MPTLTGTLTAVTGGPIDPARVRRAYVRAAQRRGSLGSEGALVTTVPVPVSTTGELSIDLDPGPAILVVETLDGGPDVFDLYVTADMTLISEALAESAPPHERSWVESQMVQLRGETVTAAGDAQAAKSDAEGAASVAEGHRTHVDSIRETLDEAAQSNVAPYLTQSELNATYDPRSATIYPQAGNHRSILQAWVDAPSPLGVKKVVGTWDLSSFIDVPSDTYLDLSAATINQTAPLTTLLRINGKQNVTIVGGILNGLGTDWTNASSVYASAAITLTSTGNKNITISNVQALNFSGAGVNAQEYDSLSIDGCRFTGPGSTVIPRSTGAFGAGVRILDGVNWAVTNCDISGSAQGIVTGNTVNARVNGNYIHDIAGQHGAYLSSTQGLTFTGNLIRGTGLQGLKIQVYGTLPDSLDIVIAGNSIIDTWSHAILLTNSLDGGASESRFRRVSITGNVLKPGSQGSDADCLNLSHCIGLTISGNHASSAVRHGMAMENCTDVAADFSIHTAGSHGVRVHGCERVTLRGRIDNPAQTAGAAANWGLSVSGTTKHVDVDMDIVDTTGKMRWGARFWPTDAADLATYRVKRLYSRGATEYGARFDHSGSTVGEWRNIDVEGGLGSILSPPAAGGGVGRREVFGTAAPSTGWFRAGDIAWNSAPVAGGVPGWVCVTTGSPGSWKAMPSLAS